MTHTWPLVPLGDVLAQVSRPEPVKPDETYRILGAHWYAQGLYIKEITTGAGVQANSLYRVNEGDFVYNRLFAWKGSFAVATQADDGCYVSNEFPCFQAHTHRLDAKFLWKYFSRSSAWDEALAGSTGGTPTSRNRLKEEKLLAFRIPLPPLDEQRPIVARIEALAAKVEEARGVRRQSVEKGEALIGAAARTLFGSVRAPWSKLGDWTDPKCDGIQTGPFGAQLGSGDFAASGVPVLTIGNVHFGGLTLADLKYVTREKAEQLARYQVKAGDILFARMGTVGRCCLAPPQADGWLINYHIIRVRLDKSRVEPRYVHWSIRASPDVEAYLEETIRGATRQGVNSGIVSGLPCRVPGAAEQRQIVAHLDSLQAKVDALKQLQAETAAQLDALLPSILDRALKGLL